MKKTILNIAMFLFCSYCYGQTDTLIKKHQKGFLFLTNHNYQYDWEGAEIRKLGFHDFFFPSECIDTRCFLDSNINLLFKNGIRVDYINNRKQLKNKATVVSCIDTSYCYEYDRFYVIPVVVDYKIFEDYEPFVCRRNYFELQVKNGSRLRFEYLHKAIKPLRIIPTGVAVKKK